MGTSVNRVPVKADMLRWARECSGADIAVFDKRFPQLGKWERGAAQLTLKRIEGFAKATHMPVGYLFLAQPPEEVVLSRAPCHQQFLPALNRGPHVDLERPPTARLLIEVFKAVDDSLDID